MRVERNITASCLFFVLLVASLLCGCVTLHGTTGLQGDEDATAKGAAVFSGEWGDCGWSIFENGLLEITPSNGESGKLADSRGFSGSGANQDDSYFPWYAYGETITEVSIAPGVSLPGNCSGMFSGCSIKALNASDWDTSSVESMKSMFSDCSLLDSLDVSRWDTSSVTDMQSMFAGCSSLEILDISSWDMTSVENKENMFDGCPAGNPTLGIASWGEYMNTFHLSICDFVVPEQWRGEVRIDTDSQGEILRWQDWDVVRLFRVDEDALQWSIDYSDLALRETYWLDNGYEVSIYDGMNMTMDAIVSDDQGNRVRLFTYCGLEIDRGENYPGYEKKDQIQDYADFLRQVGDTPTNNPEDISLAVLKRCVEGVRFNESPTPASVESPLQDYVGTYVRNSYFEQQYDIYPAGSLASTWTIEVDEITGNDIVFRVSYDNYRLATSITTDWITARIDGDVAEFYWVEHTYADEVGNGQLRFDEGMLYLQMDTTDFSSMGLCFLTTEGELPFKKGVWDVN